jgi:hypothetical protein
MEVCRLTDNKWPGGSLAGKCEGVITMMARRSNINKMVHCPVCLMPYHLRGIGPHRKAKHPNNDHATPNLTETEALEVANRRANFKLPTKAELVGDLVNHPPP